MKSDVETVAYTKVQSGELAGTTSSTRMPDIPCKRVIFFAMTSNPSNAYIGGNSSVTIPNGTTNTTGGIPLDAGDASPWFPISNLNKFFYICDSADDELLYIALG